MSANDRSLRTLSTTAFQSLAKTKIRQGIALTTTLLLAISSLAQETPPPTPQPDSQTTSPDALSSAKPAPASTTVTVPAGSRIALVLTQPIQTRRLHRGDDIYAQIVSPVTAGNEVVIPPGCSGPPPGCLSSSVTAPGSAAKGTIIGAAVGGAVGAVASITLLFNTHNFFLDVGSPIEMLLQHPLTLEQDQVAEAVRDAEQHPVREQPIAQRPQPPPLPPDPGTCWTPGTPGTPDTDIPGTPGIGGSPGTPPTPHPCP